MQKLPNFDVVAFAGSVVAPIDRDNPENVWNCFNERNQLCR